MPRQVYTASEAARRLAMSFDTLRRWDRDATKIVGVDCGTGRPKPH